MSSIALSSSHVVIAAVLTVTVVGFVSGTREPKPPIRASGAPIAAPGDDQPVPRYREIGRAPRGPNASVYDKAFGYLRPLPSTAPPQTRAEAVASRATRRAYDGAPPIVPHAVEDRGVPSCLACHEKGAAVGGRVAPIMSHTAYGNCLQCHAMTRDGPPFAPPSPDNRFSGTESSGVGERAWAGAPPSMPHSTWMRNECSSCHGAVGQPGLRTSHPERQNCLQCHPPTAAREQRFPRIEPFADADRKAAR